MNILVEINTRTKGLQNEEIACKYLQDKGFHLIEKNSFQGHKEIDLVMWKNDFIVFVEVKSVSKQSEFVIYETLNSSKKRKLKSAINSWLSRSNNFNSIWRLDFVGIVTENNKVCSIEHFEFIEL